MNPPATAAAPGKVPAQLAYQFVCLAGLAMLFLGLALERSSFLGLVVAAAGLLGILSRVRLAPVLLLLVLTAALSAQQLIRGSMGLQGSVAGPLFRPSDLALCCGALAYVAGHYRLQGLADHLLPLDRRRREQLPRPGLLRLRPPPVRRQRSGELVTAWELSLFFLTLPAWALLAEVCRSWLVARRGFLELPPPFARFLVAVWVLVLGGIVVGSLLNSWRSRTMTAQEATMLLQDVAWRETRREQRRLQRWLTWAKLRGPKGEGLR